VIILIAIVNSFAIPLTLSFERLGEELHKNTLYQVVNVGSTFFFIADIMLNARTTYYTKEGEQIFDDKKILKNYLNGMFVVDLISSIPIELMFPGSLYRIINILKLLRI
jgi:hypothetical protein